ncbi:hypothetical protein TFLX_04553 [Thermoflexales bacterium]|nr:hypothetical protein TFLX_04553 [Thermoflexales bacterium]
MSTRTLVLLAFVIGAVLGLAYAWLIEPVTFSESSPAQVMKPYREAWLIMAAEAYVQDGDWARTQARLNALRDADLSQTLTALFERYQANGPNPTARALARLADRLNVRTPAMQVYLAAITTPTPEITPARGTTGLPRPIDAPEATPTMTPEPLPRLPPTVTPNPDYQVIDRVAECTFSPQPPQIRVVVQDEFGQSVPGKVIWITWEDGGQDRFVTGLKPEIDPGYGDFDMQPDRAYNVGVDKPTSVIVSGLRADACETDGRTSWRLILTPRLP